MSRERVIDALFAIAVTAMAILWRHAGMAWLGY